jgi:cytochrome P450
MDMSDLSAAIKFAARIYRRRALAARAGYVMRDPMALYTVRPHRTDPYPVYEQLRTQGTLNPNWRGGWLSTSHRVCDSVLRDRRFGACPEKQDENQAAPRDVEMSFVYMNPPDHTRLRRLAMPAFSPKAVAGYTGRIEQVVSDLLDTAAKAGEFDLVSEFAAALPIAVISDLLGIPDSDSAAFTRYGMIIGSALGGVRSLRHAAQLKAANTELSELFEHLFELRRREPRDDIVSTLVAAEGDQVEPGEMLPMCTLLLFAGFETTVNLIGNGVLALLAHPAQWRALCAAPEAMAAKAVEETLRFDPPVQMIGRFALEPLELEAKPLRKGEYVTALVGAANRDPEVYDHPGRFDLGRDNPPPHLAFSSGIHYCIGQPFARLEAEVAFMRLAERMPGLTSVGKVKRRSSPGIRGPMHLPVSVGRTMQNAIVLN